LAMGAALVAVTVPQIVTIHSRIYYQTDSAALDHVATRVLAHGIGPLPLYQPLAMLVSITLRAPARSLPVDCM